MIYLIMFIVFVSGIYFSAGESRVEKKVDELKWQSTEILFTNDTHLPHLRY